MPSPRSSSSDLVIALDANGLKILGTFQPDGGEIPFPDKETQPATLAIVGNVGSGIWPHYQHARQNSPGLTLDRWTEEVVGGIAGDFGLDAVYPFEGPPYHPFIQWAERTGTLFASPIGLTIHPDYGLWIAFRAALLIDDPIDAAPVPARRPARHRPCDSCEDRPCLTTCPVGAFTAGGYDFQACLDHLATPANACREGGCLARIACPVGREHRYQMPHAAFHMQRLLIAHGRT